ncbi:metallophosphoesterase [Rhizobium gallicum]|uniref:metallophosphoesterase n=1 Tax=Rhizobium gallicum TaxID=56730 RepID=UPI00142DAEF1|nr:metallophosphoesterase [Rhizobium gallicum]
MSDIHCGKGQLVDEDLKDHIPNAERLKQLKRLREYITELPSKPDFVIVSGDITIRGQEDGFEEFRLWLLDLIASGHLPPRERIMVVPGNHDVTRQTREPQSSKKQFQLFWDHFCTTFPHSHIPDLDPRPVDNPTVDKDSVALQGGISTKEINGKIALVENLPFLLSLEHDLLIYGFNSAHGCGVPGKPDAKIIENLRSLINLAGPDERAKAALTEIEKAYLDSLVIDAGMITDDQLLYFHRHMSSLKKTLGERFERLTKIAVLHHHVSNLWSQPLELKKFEAVVDAGQLKQGLIEQSFDIVVHGHKHLNHVGLDGALIPIQRKDRYNPLCIVSGGTIAGFPRHGDRATFKVLEFPEAQGPRRAGIVRETPLRGFGNIPEAIRCESSTFNVPVNSRQPELHDFSSAKVKLDDALVEKCSNELNHPSGSTARDVELANSRDSVVSETLRYRCYAQLTTQNSSTFYEVLQVTKKLRFRDYSRLRWFVTAAEENFDPVKNNKIVINIGNFENTHFSEADAPNEIRNSISKLESYFRNAIDKGIVEVRVHNFSQDELINITRASLA